MENYYEILGVNENATQDEIKRAYRKKAVEHHPDKGGSEEVFKNIASAYDTLSDEQKRKDYDYKRKNPFNNRGNPFGGFNPFEDFINQSFQQQRKRAMPDKVIEINVGVLESYKASEKEITYIRNHGCMTCSGSGGDVINCDKCGGLGHITIRQGTGLFVQITRQICEKCMGNGHSISNPCISCNGKKTVPTTETFSIKLPHGVDEGQIFRIKSRGDFINGQYNNLSLKVKLVPENNFEKNGNDLIYNLFYNLEDLKKDVIDIPHPSGAITINLPSEIDTSKPLRVKSKGFNTNGVGDLFIKQFVRFKRVS